MIPVYQRHHDDCLRAALASLLQLPYEATLPVPTAGVGGKRQWKAMQAWLKGHGLSLLEWPLGEVPLTRLRGSEVPVGYWLGTVDADQNVGGHHAVVMRGRRLVHDPNPEPRKCPVIFRAAAVIVPLYPATCFPRWPAAALEVSA